jgi:hypothetical protein
LPGIDLLGVEDGVGFIRAVKLQNNSFEIAAVGGLRQPSLEYVRDCTDGSVGATLAARELQFSERNF